MPRKYTSEEVRRLMDLRSSSAAGPRKTDLPRKEEKKRAIREQTDDA